MIAIDKPFISDFLLKSIEEFDLPVIRTEVASNMIGDHPIHWISEEDARNRLRSNPLEKVYTNSENSIGWLEQNAKSTRFPKQIQWFKNKVKFRELMSDSFPDYFFRGVSFEELRGLDLEPLIFPLVVKPAVGFFSIGVHRIEHPREWDQTITLIESEVEKWRGTYPREVINTSDFILEQCIEGEEYAVDCYFDQQGKPVILNIFHHLFSSGKDVSDRVYCTSEQIINTYHRGIQEFLEMVGNKTKLVNFPAHVELRIDSSGQINPIEVNPLRFGGWCTTGDLSWFAYGINSYDYFFNSKSPHWKEIFKSRKGKTYSVVVLDNNSGYDESKIKCFMYDKLLKDFEKPMDLRKVDFRTYAVFGFLFAETSVGNEGELTRILTSNLREYIKLKGA